MREWLVPRLPVILVALLFVNIVKTSPLPFNFTQSPHGNNSVELQDTADEGDFFEGDIILLPEQKNYIEAQADNKTGVKTLISDPTAIWPDKTVYYEFANNEFSYTQRNLIEQALSDLMSASCVKFVRRTTQPTYLRLRNNARGCAAAVGYHNYGPLDLFLGGFSCQTRGTIQHEFLHSLGFWHEHTRRDRDNYVTVNWHNISPGKEVNFLKRDASEIMNLDLPYDYGSVMHYRSIAFSRNLFSQTITPKNVAAATRMGQRIRFSNTDLAKLNRLYQCPPTYYLGDDLLGQDSTIGQLGTQGLEVNRNSNSGLVLLIPIYQEDQEKIKETS